MAEQPVVHIGENSPEQVAYKLTKDVLMLIEKHDWGDIDRKTYLDTYAECLLTVGGTPRGRR